MLPCFGAFFYVAARCFSLCLIFWCFWIKPKARKKESKRIFFRSILRETILPLRLCVSCKERIYHLLSPKGGAKVSARRKAAGNSQRLAKTGACRGFASKPAPFFNARRCSFLFPHFSQGGDCCALRATMIYYDLTSSILSFSRPRPARSHCENSGSCDVIGASARSDRAKSEVFRDRSASAGVVIRYFSPCLIFWRFWIKPKARKKNFKRR